MKLVLFVLLLALFFGAARVEADPLYGMPQPAGPTYAQPPNNPMASNYALPMIEEFMVPLSVDGRKERLELDNYWRSRRAQLDLQNQQCLNLRPDMISDCLNRVRETEIRKSNAMMTYNQRSVQEKMAKRKARGEMIDSINAQYQNQAQLNYLRDQQLYNNQPFNMQCSQFGNMTNCNGY